MFNMKRWMGLLLAVAMLLTLTACGDSKKRKSIDDDEDEEEEEETAVTTTVTGEETTTTTVTHTTICPKPSGGDFLDYRFQVPSDYMAAENTKMGLTGSKALKDYSDGIKLPALANAHVTTLMSIDWAYLQNYNNEEDPFEQYHATLMWEAVYADQGGTVDIIKVTESEMTTHMITTTATGEAPDIIPMNYDLTYPRWNAAGLTSSVERYSKQLGLGAQFKGEDIYNADFMDKYFQWGGKAHGAITVKELDRQFIVYNKTMFDNNMETTPLKHWQSGTWNWTQFVDTAQNLTDAENRVYGFTGWGLFPYFAPYPMIKIDEATGHASLNIDDAKYVRYMTEVYNFYQNSGAVDLGFDSLQQWSSLFPRGTAAMVMTTKAGFKRVVETAHKLKGDTFGIAPVPAFDPAGEIEGIPNATLWGYGISKAAKNPEGAATYICLEAKVARNIEDVLGGDDWFEENLTDDEKEMLEEIDKGPVCMEVLRSIGDCYMVVDANIVPAIYYMEAEGSVAAIFDSYKNMLQQEIDLFNQIVDEN